MLAVSCRRAVPYRVTYGSLWCARVYRWRDRSTRSRVKHVMHDKAQLTTPMLTTMLTNAFRCGWEQQQWTTAAV